MAEITWTKQALEDLEAVCAFISRDSPYYARLFARQVFERVERLEPFPLSGRVVPEVKREEVREIIFGNYRIVYRLLHDEAEIITVHHGAMPLDVSNIEERE